MGLLVLAILAIVPAAALAHQDALGNADAPLEPAAAAALGAEQEAALESLPAESRSGECTSTEHVAGIGDACRTREGLFRVELASGESMTTHGGDAPLDPDARIVEAPHQTASQEAINGASVADVECVTGTSDRRVELVYAYPANQASRIAEVAGPLRLALYQASAFVDAEARSILPSAGRRIRVLCSGGVPVVHEVQVPATTPTVSFSTAVNQIVAAGFPAATWNSTSPRRVFAFYDSRNSNGAAGTAALWDDDTPGATNLNNNGGRYAIEWAWSASKLPHWDVLLHEIGHNMGAVADAAPDASGNGHCNDGLDIMCYSDGGSTSSYTTTECTVERLDCGGDTYFNPAPTAGSWLATHWNMASTNNAWLQPRDASWSDGGVPDVAAPSVPAGIDVTGITTTGFTASWSASTDDRSSVTYYAYLDSGAGGSWTLDRTIGPMSGRSTSFTGLSVGSAYRLRITARDQAGNVSAESAPREVSTSVVPILLAPDSVTSTQEGERGVRVAWSTGTATVGIASYELSYSDGLSSWWYQLGATTGTSALATGLTTGRTWTLRVRTVASDGTRSSWRASNAVYLPIPPIAAPPPATVTTPVADPAPTPPDTGTPPTTTKPVDPVIDRTPRGDATPPTLVRLIGAPKVSGSIATIRFGAATDADGISRYELQRLVGTSWKFAGRTSSSARSMRVAAIKPRSVTRLRIRAVDRSGHAGGWRVIVVRRR